jgi:argininosuccinate lyase
VAVDLRLYGREQLLATIQELCLLANELMIHARNHQFVPMVGRTHMQPAMPSSVGLFMSAHVESLLDDLLLVINAFEMNDQCPLGSAAGYGVPLPIKRELTAELLGFSSVQHNVLYASTSRGKMESIILSALSQVMVSLSRLAQDLILYSMPEFGYFLLPEAYCTGSSIMPQKRNPDVLELVRAKACVVQGHYQAVTSMITSLPTGYNRDLQEAKGPFMDGFSITRSSLRICAGLISVLDIDEAALKNAFSPGVFATDLALEKVAAGMPFRDAYHQVKKELDTLADRDPAEAVAAKTHTGATAGLDLETIQNRVDAGLFFAQEEWQLHYRALSKLLDVEYPSLKKRRK